MFFLNKDGANKCFLKSFKKRGILSGRWHLFGFQSLKWSTFSNKNFVHLCAKALSPLLLNGEIASYSLGWVFKFTYYRKGRSLKTHVKELNVFFQPSYIGTGSIIMAFNLLSCVKIRSFVEANSESSRRNWNTLAYHTAFVKSILTQEIFFHEVKYLEYHVFTPLWVFQRLKCTLMA